MDNADSDSEVELSRKRKVNVLEDHDSDESDEDDEDTGSESEDDGGSDQSEDNNMDDPGDDVIPSDDINDDQCAICLMEFSDQKLGVPNNCAHVFCLVCLQEWAKNINTCPVDRKVFCTIAVKKAKNGVTIEQIKVEDRTNVKEEFEDPTTCEVCGVGDREDRMLLCDRCDRGYHLECLTPALDNVPDEEWFCQDCFVVNAQHGNIDYSQHAIYFSDEETPTFESLPRSMTSGRVQVDSSSRASTSQQRRARTVASSRTQQRRRRRRRTQGSRQGSKQKKTTKKKKTSDKGTSTSKTRGTKPKKRRRKKRRKSMKTSTKTECDGKVSLQNSTRYLFPHEMEPTATFSLFGSDFDLEYLPVVQTPVTAAAPTQTSPPSSTTSNPDVLGSIFTRLDALHSNSLSVDRKGRVRIGENNAASKSATKPKVSVASAPSTSNINKEKGLDSSSGSSRSTYSSERTLGRSIAQKNTSRHSNDPRTEEYSQDQSYNDPNMEKCSRQFINEKRIKRFDTSSSAPTTTKPKTDREPLVKNTKTFSNSGPVKTEKLIYEEVKNLSSYSNNSARDLSETQVSLQAYKIPKKQSSATSSFPVVKIKHKETLNLKSDTKSVQDRIVKQKLKVPNVPQQNVGIFHLLPPKGEMSTCRSGQDGRRKKDVLVKPAVSKASSSSVVTSVPNVNNAHTSRNLISNPSLGPSSRTLVEFNRPIAVVLPTKVDQNSSTCGELARDAENAAEKRRKGIERLQRREMICEEVKTALRPFYKYREISKEDYKYIYSRAVEKISKSSLPVVSRDVASLVKNYVKKLKGRQIQSKTQ